MTLVGKILGLRPNIDIVRAFDKRKWSLKGQVEITTMSKGALFLAFSCNEDMSQVICDGPWLIGKAPLALQKWVPKMKLNESFFVQAPVWVRLSGLPLEFSMEDVFKGVASSFGELLSMDPITTARRRLTFAMIYVRVTQVSNMPLSIEINSRLGKWNQPLEYESVSFASFHCKKAGHTTRKCPLQVAKEKEKKERTLQWKAKNPTKQPESFEKEKRNEEAQSAIIPDMIEQQIDVNEENPEIPLNDKGKMDQTGKDDREQQDTSQEDQKSDNLEEGEIQVLQNNEEANSNHVTENTSRAGLSSDFEEAHKCLILGGISLLGSQQSVEMVQATIHQSPTTSLLNAKWARGRRC
ncbi:uncharacterized protein LOC131061959 [Cryptomeria japonica]|uniref:uncharacterized protein LOC131061959 n=1 Tax=Cryptomeria japonica TaxID=3369 RepID=UPI0027DA96F5|nr:uncharacterized protein LOC131061959 [Cryptomeria japonica]